MVGPRALELGRLMRRRGTPRNHHLLQGSEDWGDVEAPPTPSLLAPGKSDTGVRWLDCDPPFWWLSTETPGPW